MKTQKYLYVHTGTEALTGHFACEPEPCLPIDTALELLATRPFDTFLRSYGIRALAALDDTEFEQIWTNVFNEATLGSVELAIQACLAEAALARGDTKYLKTFSQENYTALCAATSLPDLAWYARADYDIVRAWNAFIRPNILEHRSLPFYDMDDADDDIPLPCDLTSLKAVQTRMGTLQGTLATIHARMQEEDRQAQHEHWERPDAEETATLALKRLEEAGIVMGHEARHEATLSPVGLLRPWRVEMRVKQRRHDYHVLGQGTTYGRGLSVPTARASCLMEMVERASAYVSVDTKDGQSFVTKRAVPTVLIKARYSELVHDGRDAFDPNTLPLEVPYADQALHWIEGFDFDDVPVLVPFQAVCLFANLDEADIFMMPSSTGIATGVSIDDAIIAACMEVIERDAEAALPWHRSQCFTIESDDTLLNSLLKAYAEQDIHIFFRDITGALGIFAYQACVRYADGRLARGAAAHLSGKKALLSALTETPYPFRQKPALDSASAPALTGLPVRRFEDLPDRTLANPTRNRMLIKELLHIEASRPVWVPLTREDLGFPVVRVLIPNKILNADVDTWSKPHPHFIAQYILGDTD